MSEDRFVKNAGYLELTEMAFRLKLTNLLKHQKTTSYDEIKTVYEKLFLASKQIAPCLQYKPLDDDKIAYEIDQTGIDGLNDKQNRQFIYKYRAGETVEYKIVASFDFGEDGSISVKCPNCKATNPLTEKKEQVVCKYCGNTYIIPNKILSLVK